MRKLSDRSLTLQDSIFAHMTAVCSRYDAVNLSQGFPDLDPPAEILDRLRELTEENCHQYSLTSGAMDIREALAAKQKRFMGMEIDPEKEIVITCGGTEALMMAAMAVVDPGDKVVVFSPFYENYSANTILCGGEPVFIPLTPPTYSFDPERLEDAFRAGAKALILCNPNNPCGKVFTREELLLIADLVRRYDAYVITDECYEHIVYAPYEHVYFATLPGMRERTISCSSLSKTYSITGWRIGYTIAPPEITERLRKIHEFLTVCAASPLQEAVIPGLLADQSYYDELLRIYTAKRRFLLEGLDDIGIVHNDPHGAFYVLLDIGKYGYESDVAFCEDLAAKVGVGAVPGSGFFREPVNHLIRLNFAKREETMRAALDRLAGIDKMMRR